MKSATIIDREFGEITLLERSTARHLIFRIRYGSLSITHPRHTRIDAIQQCIEEKRDDLRKLFRRTEGRFLQPGDIIYTRTFVIMISCGDHHTISSCLHDNTLHIVLPQLTEYNDKNIQKSIAKHIQPHLKNAAENFLPSTIGILGTKNRKQLQRADHHQRLSAAGNMPKRPTHKPVVPPYVPTRPPHRLRHTTRTIPFERNEPQRQIPRNMQPIL